MEDIRSKLLAYIDSLAANDVIFKREIVPQCIWTGNTKRLVRYVYDQLEAGKKYDMEIKRYDPEYKMMTHIIQNGEVYDITLPFLRFICKGISAFRARTEYEKRCMEAIYIFLNQKNWPVEAAAAAGSVYEELASRYEEKRELCYRRSIAFYQGACYLTKNEKERNQLETKIGKLYMKCGSAKDLLEAEKIFEQLKERGCDVRMEVISLGEKMITLGDQSEEQAINQCVKGFNFCYKMCGSKENEWTKLMWISLKHWEDLAVKLADYQYFKSMETAYSNVALIYRKWGGIENLRKALNCFKFADVFCKKNMQMDPNRKHRKNLAWNHKEQGATYLLAGGKVNLEPALNLLQEASELYITLLKEQEEASFMNECADTYRLMGLVYSKYQEREYIQKGIACFEIMYKYWARTGFADKTMLAGTYEETAYLYMRLIGTENFKKAIEYFEKSITMYKGLLNEGAAKFEKLFLYLSSADGISSDTTEKNMEQSCSR